MPDVHGAGDHHGPRDASTSSHGCVVSNEINYGSWEQTNETNSTKRTRNKKGDGPVLTSVMVFL